jgi:hypothetical protein
VAGSAPDLRGGIAAVATAGIAVAVGIALHEMGRDIGTTGEAAGGRTKGLRASRETASARAGETGLVNIRSGRHGCRRRTSASSRGSVAVGAGTACGSGRSILGE